METKAEKWGENKANDINVPMTHSDNLNNSLPLPGTYAIVLKYRTRTLRR
jgi:hypothetical protein